MDALLFNAFATFNGLYVNMDVAKQQQKESEAEMVRLNSSLSKGFIASIIITP